MKTMLGGRAFSTNISNPDTILDLGCGTGVVTNELADAFPSVRAVYGIDMTEVVEGQASRRSNVTYIQGNFHHLLQSDSRLRSEQIDFIFQRLLIYGLQDWEGHVRKIYNALKPGGVFKMQNFCERFYFEDSDFDTLQDDSWEWLRAYYKGARQKGLDIDCGMKLGSWMRLAGFEDVHETQYKMPYYHGPGVTGTNMELVADLLSGDPDGMFYHAFPDMVRDLGMKQDEVDRLREQMSGCLAEERGKYQTYWVTTGRKPAR